MRSNIDEAKAKLLKAVYRSADRVNQYLIRGTPESIPAEEWLQTNLRKNFEDLQKDEEDDVCPVEQDRKGSIP